MITLRDEIETNAVPEQIFEWCGYSLLLTYPVFMKSMVLLPDPQMYRVCK